MRLDKWLWAARLYKTRGLAAEEVTKGRVTVNTQSAKPAKELKPGDVVEVRRGDIRKAMTVRALSHIRGPAPVAQTLYEETAESIETRERQEQARKLSPEPAASLEQGRPTKRDRRKLADWDRWSASIDGSEH